MDPEKVIDVLNNEMKCVIRADKGCDRDCAKCDLVMSTSEIVRAYVYAINAVDVIQKIKKDMSVC